MNKKEHTGLIIFLVIIAVLLAVAVGVFSFMLGQKSYKLKKQLSIGERYLSKEEYEDAISAFKKAIKIDPKCEDAYIGIAEACVELGRYDEAIDYLEKIYKITKSKTIKKKIKQILDDRDDLEFISVATIKTEESIDAIDGKTEDGPAEDEIPVEEIPEEEISETAEEADVEQNADELYERNHDRAYDNRLVFSWDKYIEDDGMPGALNIYIEGVFEGNDYYIEVLQNRNGVYVIKNCYGDCQDFNTETLKIVNSEGYNILTVDDRGSTEEGNIEILLHYGFAITHMEIYGDYGNDINANIVVSQACDTMEMKAYLHDGLSFKMGNPADFYTRFDTGAWGMTFDIDWDNKCFRAIW